MSTLHDTTDVASNVSVSPTSQECGLVSPMACCGNPALSQFSNSSQQDTSRSPIRDRSNRKASLGRSSATDVIHRRMFRRRQHDSLKAHMGLLVLTQDIQDY